MFYQETRTVIQSRDFEPFDASVGWNLGCVSPHVDDSSFLIDVLPVRPELVHLPASDALLDMPYITIWLSSLHMNGERRKWDLRIICVNVRSEEGVWPACLPPGDAQTSVIYKVGFHIF
jgi:hypothetical protein